MAGKARMRYIARTHRLQFDRDTGYHRSHTDYGVECIYCYEYFPNTKKPQYGGHVCKSCK